METILLSIKPEYVERIFDREKQYEFRRKRPKVHPKKIIIYATAPVMRVIGEATVIEMISGSPTEIWETTKESAGITREKFREYFHGCRIAFAYCLGQVSKYDNPKLLKEYGIANPPQSFIYLETDTENANYKEA